MSRKTKADLATMRAAASPKPSHAEGSNLHRFAYVHARRGEAPDVDAVCSRCGLEEIDTTPKLKKRTTRWRLANSTELLRAKPTCTLPSGEPGK